MTTKTWKPGMHNLTLTMIRGEIKRIEGEIKHPSADALVVTEQRVKLDRLYTELNRRATK